MRRSTARTAGHVVGIQDPIAPTRPIPVCLRQSSIEPLKPEYGDSVKSFVTQTSNLIDMQKTFKHLSAFEGSTYGGE